jgi:hypothetical protein
MIAAILLNIPFIVAFAFVFFRYLVLVTEQELIGTLLIGALLGLALSIIGRLLDLLDKLFGVGNSVHITAMFIYSGIFYLIRMFN